MKFVLRKGSKGKNDFLLVVKFEDSSNYDVEKHEWIPKLDELREIAGILRKLMNEDVII